MFLEEISAGEPLFSCHEFKGSLLISVFEFLLLAWNLGCSKDKKLPHFLEGEGSLVLLNHA